MHEEDIRCNKYLEGSEQPAVQILNCRHSRTGLGRSFIADKSTGLSAPKVRGEA
jgi:hypothetical protein